MTARDTALVTATARAELRGWTLAAVGALAVSGILAPMLAVSRAPGMDAYLPWAEQAFVRAIIEHVIFSVIVWTMAVFGGLMAIVAHGQGHPRAAWLGWAGLALMVPAFAMLFVPGVLSGAEPSLNNYVPTMIHPLYYAGLAVLFTALALPVVRLLINTPPSGAEGDGTAASALVYGVALICFFIAWRRLAGAAPSTAYNETLFWGGGHVLQIVNALLMLSAWMVLGRIALGRSLAAAGRFRIALSLGLLAAFAVSVLYGVFAFDSGELRDAHSKVKFFLVLPTALVGLSALPVLNAARKSVEGLPWRNPAFVALALSMGLFAIGGVMGYFADGTDTRTPGHYHAVLGGLNLAFFGLVMFRFLPLAGRPLAATRWRFAPLYIYALGQALQSGGMFMAAAPRKTMGQAQMLVTAPERLGMHLNHTGALIAVVGGILFVWIVGRALLRRLPSDAT